MSEIVKLRDNALIVLKDGLTVRRNVYSSYISNANPVWCRVNNQIMYLTSSNPHTDKETFWVTLEGHKYKVAVGVKR